jgi:hypothetical protein
MMKVLRRNTRKPLSPWLVRRLRRLPVYCCRLICHAGAGRNAAGRVDWSDVMQPAMRDAPGVSASQLTCFFAQGVPVNAVKSLHCKKFPYGYT